MQILNGLDSPAFADPAYSSSASPTEQASWPVTPTVWQEGGLDAEGATSRPNVGIRPTSPQKDAGMRTLPPPSLPARASTALKQLRNL